MAELLKKGSSGAAVRELQKLLVKRGYAVDIDGRFGPQTYRAVRAFQSQNLDQHGQPLTIDGVAGPITWWSLSHPKPLIEKPSAVDYGTMPPKSLGGSRAGRAALAMAIRELKAGAGEIGGNNRGKWVKKYLEPAGLKEGSSWCAAFVSWCFLAAHKGDRNMMPFQYSAGARDIQGQFRKKGWASDPQDGYEPRPGDLVFWWRESLQGWKGHIGLVHQLRDGMLYVIEGNKSPKVEGFSYVLSRMERLLGFGQVPDR